VRFMDCRLKKFSNGYRTVQLLYNGGLKSLF
jgi:hypothetical protein